MRWVTFPKGTRAHVVLETDLTRTIEGMTIPVGATLHDGLPADSTLCQNCDARWREKGRDNKPPRKHKTAQDRRTTYHPRFTLKDWEER
jgi:hypothetical protein